MPYAPWDAGGYYPFTYGRTGSSSPVPLGGSSGAVAGGQFGGQTGGFTGYSSLPNYGISPAPTQGQGAYGLVPGQIGIPPSTYSQTLSALPGLGAAGTQATSNIMNELQGQISPQALRNIQDAAARFGVSSGMPGSNAVPGTLAMNANLLGNYRTTEQLQQQGQQDYRNLLGAVGQQQINPALAAEIAAANAQLRAAPDPQKAAEQQLANYWAALGATRGLGLQGGRGYGGIGNGPAGGTGSYAAPPSALGFGFGSLGQLAGGLGAGSGSGYGFGGPSSYTGMSPLDSSNFDNFWNYGSNIPSDYTDYTDYSGDYGSPPVDYNWLNYIDDTGGY